MPDLPEFLVRRGTDCLFSELPFLDYLGRQRHFLYLEPRSDMRIAHYQIFKFSKIKVPFRSHHCLCRYHLALFAMPSGNSCKTTTTLVTPVAVINSPISLTG